MFPCFVKLTLANNGLPILLNMNNKTSIIRSDNRSLIMERGTEVYVTESFDEIQQKINEQMRSMYDFIFADDEEEE